MKTHYERLMGPLQASRQYARQALTYGGGKLSPDVAAELFRAVWRRARTVAIRDPQGKLREFNFSSSLERLQALYYEVINLFLDALPDPYSESALMTLPAYQEVVKMFFEQGFDDSRQSVMLSIAYQTLSWERAGSRTYVVTPGLGEQLSATELRGVPTDDLKLPYESLFVVVPREAGLFLEDPKSGMHRVEGMYVTRESFRVKGDTVQSYIQSRGLVRPELEPVNSWRVMVVGEDKSPDPDGMPNDDALNFFQVLLPPGALIEEALDYSEKTYMDDVKGMDIWKDPVFQGHIDSVQKCWRQMFRWLMNVILYTTWTDPGEKWMPNREARQLWERIQKLPKGPKRKALLERFQKSDRQQHIILGKNVVVSRQLLDYESPGQEDTTAGAARGELRVRTRVAGHWRRVAHGPGRTERRWQFIEPFWRGPEDGILNAPKHELR